MTLFIYQYIFTRFVDGSSDSLQNAQHTPILKLLNCNKIKSCQIIFPAAGNWNLQLQRTKVQARLEELWVRTAQPQCLQQDMKGTFRIRHQESSRHVSKKLFESCDVCTWCQTFIHHKLHGQLRPHTKKFPL